MSSSITIGCVKWFNTKSGFGFITVTDGPESGKDIFAHHSSIVVDADQYRYLVPGEYVEFEIYESKNIKYQFQAENITGINGGKLMCETRLLNRLSRRKESPQREQEETPQRKEPAKRPETKQRRELAKRPETTKQRNATKPQQVSKQQNTKNVGKKR
jgi:cold shock CspA family protein